MPTHINDHLPDAPTGALSDDQFAELKALLQPGFELSTLMLAEYKAKMEAAREPAAKKPAPPEPPAD